MYSPVRLRLILNPKHLTKSQKSEGLKRSWVLLKPDLETIYDLESYIVNAFDLLDTCPNGIILYMDGFVIPSFESTQVIKNNDVVRVKRRACTLEDVVKRVCNEVSSPEDSGIPEKGFVPNGVKLLAIEEFEKENGGYQSEPEENSIDVPNDDLGLETSPNEKSTTSKKRKSTQKLQSAKRKKVKSYTPEKFQKVPTESDDNGVDPKLPKRCHAKSVKKNSSRNNKASKKTGKLIVSTAVEDGDKDSEAVQSMADELRHKQIQENGKEDRESSRVPEVGTEKVSRSSRRKKAQRKLKREQLANAVNNEKIQSNTTKKDSYNESQESQSSDEDDEMETEVVPIHKLPQHQPSNKDKEMDTELVPRVVRPGHIRFEPLDEDDVRQQSEDPVVNFQWSGTTSKKRGQKWGQEKALTSRNNGYNEFREASFEKITDVNAEVVDPVDFEKLKPLYCLPKGGDVLAYRLVELSSSWSPELSSYRVGKVEWYEAASKGIMLVPVPGYPVFSDEKGDGNEEAEAESEPDISLYKEDGSLEIDFASLIDVRCFNLEKSKIGSMPGGSSIDAPISSMLDSSPKPIDCSEKSKASATGNGIWKVNEALNEKKMQLLQKEGWPQEENPVKRSWTFRALRSSALGPTMALLRSGNNLSV